MFLLWCPVQEGLPSWALSISKDMTLEMVWA